MPTYAYQCECGHRFEEFYKKIGTYEPNCPKCGSDKTKRKLEAPTVDPAGFFNVRVNPESVING